MKKGMFFLAAFVFVTGTLKAQEFTVKGELKNFKPLDKVYLFFRDGDNTVQDSAEVKEGKFKFGGKVSEPVAARLQVKYKQEVGSETAKQENLPLFLDGGKIEVTAKDSLRGASVSGSKGQTDFQALQKAEDAYSPQLEKLYDNYRAARKEGNKEEMKKVESQIEAVDAEVKEKVYGSFLKKNSASPVALYALQQYAGWDMDPDKIEPLFNTLPGDQQKRSSAIAFKERIDIAKKTAVGRYAMDFTQNDTLDKPVSLSSFKGKYVLVDFWASWCGPCRQENPNVVKAFNKYRDKNFTVLSVSLDRPNAKERWLKAIHDDNLTWTHVSDLKFWDNEVAKQYGIRAIPQNLLVDPGGKIIAKNLNGESLEQKLGEVLSQ